MPPTSNALLVSEEQPQETYTELSEREYAQVFEQYFTPIRNFIYFKCGDGDQAEDIAQDVFVKLWQTRGRIAMSTVKSYLYTIANNLTINQLKRRQLKFKMQQSTVGGMDTKDPQYLAEMKEYEERLHRVINAMTEGSREVFLMNRIEGMKYKEIAENLSISVKAVEKRMSKALAHIKEHLGVSI